MAENRKRITRRTTSRATVLTMVFGALAIIVAIRLAYLQVYSYDYYKEQVMNEITMETEVNPERRMGKKRCIPGRLPTRITKI